MERMKTLFPYTPRSAFTLVEVLVVLSIIAVLAAILFPVLGRARESARRSSCQSNLRQIGLAFLQYTQDFDENYPLTTATTLGGGMSYTPASSWTTSTQSYIRNAQIYRCPSDNAARWDSARLPPDAPPFTTSYVLNDWFSAGRIGAFASVSASSEPAREIILAEKAENLAAMLAEADHFHPQFWGTPPELASGMAPLLWNAATGTPIELAVKRHFDGFNALFADGHVKWGRFERFFNAAGASPAERQGAFRPR